MLELQNEEINAKKNLAVKDATYANWELVIILVLNISRRVEDEIMNNHINLTCWNCEMKKYNN